MKITSKVMTVVALSTSVAQMLASGASAKVTPIKIEMIKTDFASRSKSWLYQVKLNEHDEWFSVKFIKQDAKIPVILGKTKLKITTTNAQNVDEQLITTDYLNKKIAIDKDGNISPRTPAEIKKMIETSKQRAKRIGGVSIANGDLVLVTVKIPTDKIKVSDVVKSTPKALGNEYYDAFTIRDDTRKDAWSRFEVPLKVLKVSPGEQNKASFIRINDKPGRRIIIRNRADETRNITKKDSLLNRELDETGNEIMEAKMFAGVKDQIAEGSKIIMGRSKDSGSGNDFFVE